MLKRKILRGGLIAIVLAGVCIQWCRCGDARADWWSDRKKETERSVPQASNAAQQQADQARRRIEDERRRAFEAARKRQQELARQAQQRALEVQRQAELQRQKAQEAARAAQQRAAEIQRQAELQRQRAQDVARKTAEEAKQRQAEAARTAQQKADAAKRLAEQKRQQAQIAAQKTQDTVVRTGQKLGGNIPEQGKKLGGRIANDGKRLGGQIARDTKQLRGDISQGGKRLGGEIAKGGKTIGGQIARDTKQLGGDISQSGNRMGGEIAKGGKRVGGNIANEGKTFGEHVSRAGKQVGGGISENGKTLGGHIANVGKQVGGQVSDGAKNDGRAVSDWGKERGSVASKGWKRLGADIEIETEEVREKLKKMGYNSQQIEILLDIVNYKTGWPKWATDDLDRRIPEKIVDSWLSVFPGFPGESSLDLAVKSAVDSWLFYMEFESDGSPLGRSFGLADGDLGTTTKTSPGDGGEKDPGQKGDSGGGSSDLARKIAGQFPAAVRHTVGQKKRGLMSKFQNYGSYRQLLDDTFQNFLKNLTSDKLKDEANDFAFDKLQEKALKASDRLSPGMTRFLGPGLFAHDFLMTGVEQYQVVCHEIVKKSDPGARRLNGGAIDAYNESLNGKVVAKSPDGSWYVHDNPKYVPNYPTERAFRNGRREPGNGQPYSRPENLGGIVFERTMQTMAGDFAKGELRDWMLKQILGK